MAAQSRQLARTQLRRSHPDKRLHAVRIATSCGLVQLHLDKDGEQDGRLRAEIVCSGRARPGSSA